MICRLPYVDSMKCEKLIQQMKRGDWAILEIFGPSNAPIVATASILVGVIMRLPYPSLFGSMQPQGGIILVFNPDI